MAKPKDDNQMNAKFEENIIDWCTFYRRNIHRFVEHYFGIELFFFQKIMIYLMHRCPLVVLICARAVSKSFTTAVYACAVCVLYPGSKVLVTAMTKKQAGLLITEKVKKELMVLSTNLEREIKEIKTSQNDIEVVFKNGSSFIATVAGEQARGLRSTILITDEFRLVKKEVLDSILVPTEIPRPVPYRMKKEFSGDEFQENPREIYLSSAFFKSHWMWNHIRMAMSDSYKNKAILFCTDYATTLKHGIKTRSQMEKARKMSDPITFDMEYNNFMMGGAENQFYSFELVNESQKLKKAWYPKTLEEYGDKKKNWFGYIPKKKGEKRIVSIDIAVAPDTDKTKNDFTVIKCVRALLTGERYERQEVYIESYQGETLEKQAIRVRQIMEDFEADNIVIDGRTYGTTIIDEFAKVLYDDERDIEYDPIKCFNYQPYADRCKNPNASPIIYAFIGSADSNDSMHRLFKGSLIDGKYKMLVSHTRCIDDYLSGKREYDMGNPEEKARFERPYIYSDLTLNEMINLSQEFVQSTKIKLVEPSTGTKDKYIASGMANLFIQELETQLTEREEGQYSDEDDVVYW